MTQLDETFLADVGLGNAPQAVKDKTLAIAQDTLQGRVGDRLADELTDEQLTEFEKIADDTQKANEWLMQNFPNYKEVVQEEVNKLKHEIKATGNAFTKQ